MKTLIKTISAAAIGLSLAVGQVQADETQPGAVNPFDFANPMTWFNMTGTGYAATADSGQAFHPIKPQSWAGMVSPEGHEKFHMAMTNPATYAYYMQPAFYMEFMNPANYMAWMNPASYQTFMNPATYAYWMTPNAYMHMMDPGMYAGMFDMNSYFTLMNPGTYMGWMDPNLYTQMWSEMMDPASYMAAIAPAGESTEEPAAAQ